MPKPKSLSQAEPGEADAAEYRLDPIIEGMLERLPAPGDPFPDRRLWLDILEMVLRLIYPEEESEESQEPPSGEG